MSGKKSNSIKGGKGDDVLVGSLDADSIEGKDGDDTLSGLAGRDVIDGGKGDDSIDGGADGDLLAGGKGDDQIRGGAGDDLLFGDGSIKGSGHGWASGKASGAGSGKDTGKDTGKDSGKHGGKGSKPEWDKWVSNQGTGTGKGSKKGSKASGSGGNGDDYLDGGAGSDQLFAGGGSDIGNYQLAENLTSLDAYDGGDGVDTLRLNLTLADLQDADFQGDLEDYLQFLDEHTNAASGEADSATYQFNAFGLEASGWEKLEVSLAGSAGGNVTYAGDSEEPVTVDAGDENDTVIGGQAGDDINGGGGSDIILGGGGDDVIDAGEGDDLVVWESGDGNDVVDGGAGFDALDLTLDDEVPTTLAVSADAEGNVILIAEDGSILTVDGVEDIVINAGVAGSAVTIGDLTGTDIAQDTLYFVGAAGDDELDAHLTDRRINAQGNGGNDTLLSGSGNDILDGGEGDDSLDAGGGSGADVIYGGDGDDTIFATLGDEQNSNAIDLVDGGADNDQLNVTFVEPTPHDLLLKVQSNGDGSFSVTSEDIDVDENLHVTNVENLNLIAGEAALHFELGSLADTTLAGNGVNFEGSAEADFFDGSDTDVTLNLHGNSGADTLIGGSENDQLAGGAEDDSLSGSGGDDNLVGGEGNDILDGGLGHDVADYSSASAGVAVDLSIFMAQDTLGAGSDTLANIEEVTGSAFADTLSASNFGSNLNGGMGEDQLNGGDGFDFLSGGDGDDILVDTNSGLLSGDAGNDFIDGMANYHPDGSGVRVNYSDQDVDVTGDGSVIVAARTALDSYGDTDTFGAAAHNVQTSDYSDHVTGSDQDNYVLLRAGDDQAFGLDGEDFFKGGSGNDAIDAGAGFDFVSYEEDGYDGNGAPTQGVDVDLAINQAIDGFNDLDSLTNVEGIIGSALDDVIAGDSGANKLFARGGNDIVSGREGNDTLGGWSGDDSLDGGSGDDTLLGDTGNDTLTGGSGADLYLFNTPSNDATDFGHDTITDFSVTEDTLDLSLFELTNLDELKAVATDDGIDTTITIDGNRSILLQAVTLTQ
jgi:Ca2+-binding RTX toxin-like protein